MKSPTTPFRISPSAIARFFFHDCERFLRFTAASAERRAEENIPKREFDSSPLVKAILDSGYAWEELVLKNHLAGRVAIAPGPGKLHERRFNLQESIELLRTAEPGTFLYQSSLKVSPAFYDRYGIDPTLVSVSENHPDLIAVLDDGSGGRLFRVMDIKRGEALRFTHRVQILFYALELADLIREQGIENASVDIKTGAVWLGGQPEPTPIDLSDFRPYLESFLRNDLERVLRQEAQEVSWHLYFRCEWCEFFEHCQAEMQTRGDVSRLVGITPFGKRHLVTEAQVQTLGEFRTFLKLPEADQVLAQCASLAGQRPHFETQLLAHADATPKLHGASSPALPIGENIKLFLTLHQEPLGQSIYLAGLYLQAKDEVLRKAIPNALQKRLLVSTGRLQPVVFVAETPSDVAGVRRQWVELLFDILTAIDDYNNQQGNWDDKLSLQAYVQSEQEKTLLEQCLLESLQEPDLAEAAMALLFHFQAPDLMVADQHPDSEVPYAVVVLLSALGRLMALPVDVSYSLPETLPVLGSQFNYRRNDFFHFPLGHGLRAEAIHGAWHRGQTELIADIEKQAKQYLYAVSSLLQGIRAKAGSMLFAWPAKFALANAEHIQDSLLSRLVFFAKYESLLGCLKMRDIRSESRAVQSLLGKVLELEAVDDVTFQVVGEGLMELDDGGFPGWLLVEDSEEGRKAQLDYKDYYYRKNPYGGKPHSHRAIVGIDDVQLNEFGFPENIVVSYKKSFADELPEAGERFLLYPRFSDYTTDRIVTFLKTLDRKPGLFLDLLHNPAQAATSLPLPQSVETIAKREEPQLHLTQSQTEAYQAIRQTRVNPVWGPPGTGKTHFLASIILGLISAHAGAKKPFRVLVTGFTHAAIENVLRKVDELQRKSSLKVDTVALGKAKTWQSQSTAAATILDEKKMRNWLAHHEHAVVGATVYSCLKDIEKSEPFDLVVIDEASQVRVPESSVAISLVGDQGRLVLAGDHKQLPPIVTGVYPDPHPGDPLLHRSIFEAVAPREGEGSERLHQLVENFRMNDVLTSFAAGLLYGQNYQCFNEVIAARRLNWQGSTGNDEFVQTCLDPDFPLAVVVLEGVRAAKENQVEAQLLSKVLIGLREGLCDASGEIYADDSDFFREGVFIVSPHRAQIRTIQRELASLREWESTPFVDTVDKMQGQEADAVLVSYGVADPEFAMQEAEFIYSLNRLNVSMTRAKSKCVISLSRALLDATPHVLDEPEAAKGLAFMRDLVAKIQETGEEVDFDLNDAVQAVVYRTQSCLTFQE